jgi:hypothetical protein
MQVVTSENFQQLVETGKVDEFKAPTEAIAKAADAAVVVDTQPRGEDGKFVAKDAEVKADKVDEAAKAADDEDEDADLPERVRKQIGKKHRAMKEAEEFARSTYSDLTAERQRAEALERELNALKGTKSQAQPEKDSKEPNQDDFKTVGEYAEALAEYLVDKKFAAREAKQEQDRREQAARSAQDALNQRIAATVKELPDYAEVISESDLDMPPHIAVYIAESPIGPKIGYHFCKNPADFDRINKLSPIRAIAELGKLEDRLDKKPDAKADKADAGTVVAVSRAPSPITPLNGTATPVTKDPSQMTLQELKTYEANKRASRAAVR